MSQAQAPQQSPKNSPGPVDPYRDWLDIQSVERPPSRYALLGLAELEDDPQAIAEGARRIKKVVRGYQIGSYRKQALALLTEIGQAVELLGNRQKKAGYDRQRFRRAMELAKANFPQADLSRPLDEIFAEWLVDCDKARLPVARLLPNLMDWCLDRAFSWPVRGPYKTPLPLGLWIYFEGSVVGQCVERSPLEQRVAAVKQLQQAFGVSEQLARFVAVEISRRPQSFAGTRLVQEAAAAPREVMQNWLDRLAVRGVKLDAAAPTYQALAFLLGLADESGKPIAEPVQPRVIQGAGVPLFGLLRDRLRDAAEGLMAYVRNLAAEHPATFSAALLALLISLGVVLLLAGVLILISVLRR